jgi:glycosyltransferase involved in cell wall biosynthesis
MPPVVSVCIPVFNRRALISRAVDSVLAQTITDLELIVVDNASTDGTYELVEMRSSEALRLYRNDHNLGLFGNFARCMELVEGEYVRFLCSDDLMAPGTLEREIDFMRLHPSVALVSTAGTLVDIVGNRVGRVGDFFPSGVLDGKIARELLLWVLSHYGFNPLNYPSGIMIRRRAARAAGSFDPALVTAGDIDYWLRILRFGDLGVIPQEGCEILMHVGQAGHAAWRTGASLREQFHVLSQVHDYPAPLRTAITRQLAARGLWFTVKSVARGQWGPATRYFQLLRRSRVGPGVVATALARHLWLRFLFAVRRTRVLPARYRRALFEMGHVP